MVDIQKEKDLRGISINNVGIKNFMYPVKVMEKENGFQHTIATINLYVGLYSDERAIHMSRLVEIIHEWESIVSLNSVSELLGHTKKRLETDSSFAEISFPFFYKKQAPVSKRAGLVNYHCEIVGSSHPDAPDDLILKVHIPICSLCPCSKAISKNSAHNQRGEACIQIRFQDPVWIEDIITIAEKAASSDVYSVLKRPDEKYITEYSFNNAKFVEDITRDIAAQLMDEPKITWFSISVENFESIHNHNAYASITNFKKDYLGVTETCYLKEDSMNLMKNTKQWQEMEKEIRTFIYDKVLSEKNDGDEFDDNPFDDNTELVDSRILSSLSLINLLAGLEEHLDSEIINDDVGLEDFTTVNKILHSIKKTCQYPN